MMFRDSRESTSRWLDAGSEELAVVVLRELTQIQRAASTAALLITGDAGFQPPAYKVMDGCSDLCALHVFELHGNARLA
jgi:hypothetical protein